MTPRTAAGRALLADMEWGWSAGSLRRAVLVIEDEARSLPSLEALAAALPEVTNDARVPDEFMDRTGVTPDGSYFPVFSPVRFAAAILAALEAGRA